MTTIYIDADACPVKEETYRVARRYSLRVELVANTELSIPPGELFGITVREGFGAADDHIAEVAGEGDIVVTADIPLAARCVANFARVIDPRGRVFTENDVGDALAARDLAEELRQYGLPTAGPPPMTQKDRSRFLGKLDELVHAARKRKRP